MWVQASLQTCRLGFGGDLAAGGGGGGVGLLMALELVLQADTGRVLAACPVVRSAGCSQRQAHRAGWRAVCTSPRSSQAATQPAASEPGPITPPPAKRTKAEPAAEPTKGKGKASKAKPAPQPGRWLDRDCNAALNMQRIEGSRWRPLELCYWPD
ncbi:hypothetical protein QJQ45_011941 [Haematococcus lacustris]|nr:hypothetical protein QJQ45_011941 [Haematococcus lacustris]